MLEYFRTHVVAYTIVLLVCFFIMLAGILYWPLFIVGGILFMGLFLLGFKLIREPEEYEEEIIIKPVKKD
ncbi:hypothetical protein [Dehalococcoides mccartyi]|uniref:Uncharacterized protein n=1 Tax=Dehalococcoides mccartyi (strain VS) TaxID=311424 RepID=D2BJV3_DEHMV|nr:hypothetical protein [Dehalococcoides mccartyi]ACZ62603.1 hypothetical protein DhcVS_1506 [Dehalococcoides mccartyi VS]